MAPFFMNSSSKEAVFLHMLSQKQGKAYKLTKPFNGSIRIMEMFENGADIRVIDTQTI